MTRSTDPVTVKAARKAHVCDWCGEGIEIRARATQAEQEAAAWRKRFDRLLGLGLVEPAAKEAKP